jgi:hypothetical protein
MLAPRGEPAFEQPALGRLLATSARLWPSFAASLGVDVGHDDTGTLSVAVTADDVTEAARATLTGLPVRPVKGQVLRLRGEPGLNRHVIDATVDGRHVYLVSHELRRWGCGPSARSSSRAAQKCTYRWRPRRPEAPAVRSQLVRHPWPVRSPVRCPKPLTQSTNSFCAGCGRRP